MTASLATSNRLITASNDITIADALALATAQTLTLNAGHDVLINAPITAAPAGAGLVLLAGNNVNVGAALTVTGAGSSININAGNDVITSATIKAVGAASPITITAGHDITANAAITEIAAGSIISLSAGRNVNINSAISTAAAGSSISLISGLNATAPGVAGGTVVITPSASVSSISTSIRFNPISYANTSTEIAAYYTQVSGVLDARAWLFARANNKTYNGTTAAVMSFMGVPSAGGDVKMVSGTATFDTKDVGTGKVVVFNGATISGMDANKFALFSTFGSTTANIIPASLTVTAANATKTYGQTISLTGFTAAGLINGETIGAVTETSPGTVATARVDGSPYVITPNPATGGTFNPADYRIVYVNGLLTVTPQPIIAMSVRAVSVPDVTPSVELSGTPPELLNVDPVDPSSVETLPVSPNI